MLVTTRQRRWLISLDTAQLTHKLGPTTSKHITKIQTAYLITNIALPALLDMLLLQKGS